jgi:hypothetical protein
MTALMVTEAQFQSQVIDLAQALGWQHLHVRRSLGRRGGKQAWQTTTNVSGWPDLFLWHPTHGFAAIELKAGRNTPSEEQSEILAQLQAAGARTMVAWPDDLDDVMAILQGRFA